MSLLSVLFHLQKPCLSFLQRYPVAMLVLKILQNSKQNSRVGISFLIKFVGLSLLLYKKRDSGTGVFQLIFGDF